MKLVLIICAFMSIALFSCNSDQFKEISEDQFIGKWELKGRSMFDSIHVQITKNEKGAFSGKIIQLNNHKLVKLFCSLNDKWVSNIKRVSNYKFKLTEKKIASTLFSIYGQSTSKTFYVQFIDSDTFGLSDEKGNPLRSNVIYKRIKN